MIRAELPGRWRNGLRRTRRWHRASMPGSRTHGLRMGGCSPLPRTIRIETGHLLMPAAAGRQELSSGGLTVRGRQSTFSPDGQWLAYVSNESGGDEIYARRIEGNSARIQISPAGGAAPRWAANGDLFYWFSGKMFVGAGSSHSRRTRDRQPQGASFFGALPFYDVTADGQQLLMLQPAGAALLSTRACRLSTTGRACRAGDRRRRADASSPGLASVEAFRF